MNAEGLKRACPTLAGTIAATLENQGAERFEDADAFYLKPHGIYQYDDRDARRSGTRKYFYMVRVRIPGGVLSPAQYLALDELADRHGNGTLRITSRQGIQFHGVPKGNLQPLVKSINEAGLTTLAACGDNNRNVVAPPSPATDGLGALVRQHAQQVALALAPQTPAYRAVWLEQRQLDTDTEAAKNFCDPLYGAGYLPRKFKVAFAIPPQNDVDIFSHCCGFVAIADGRGDLLGYNLLAGGGMGRSHGNKATFPRLADVIGFLPPHKVVEVARAVLTIHRDFGDRTNRRHARLKYVLAERGAEWCRRELESRLGFALGEPRPFQFERQGDLFGWHTQADGQLFLGIFVETGRIRGQQKKLLRKVVGQFGPQVRLTPNSNLILTNIAPQSRPDMDCLLEDVTAPVTPLRRACMACVALPSCGQAIAEAERFLPELITGMERLWDETGLGGEEVTVRMTGCPNGCARPYTAEIGLVGKSLGLYQIWLGGNRANTRLNRLYRDMVKASDIIGELRPLLVRYKAERQPDECFGDWAARAVQFP
ncbi:MAG: NADPH-dependent assimilatory sulfite reductase hemoprotein subunit [Verrucomicrobiae bacterium]|nr:NADPH-dependent assimilatory sulfite reductase hemoprotein subunit [Verrucomicrobiae bacterium]